MELKALTGNEKSKLENNRFELVDSSKDNPIQEEIMTTNELKALGGPNAEMMIDAIEKMPDGKEKAQLKQGLKSTYSELAAGKSSSDDFMDGGTHTALGPSVIETGSDSKNSVEWTSPDSVVLKINATKTAEKQPDAPTNWFEAAQKIAALPLDKQLQVIGAGFNSGLTEYDRQYRERSIGALIGSVQGVGNVLTNIGKIADFSAYVIINDHDRASAMGAEFGTALGQTVVGGFKLFECAHHYLNDVGFASYKGDNTKVFRDIATLGENLDKTWSELPPREQSRIFTKLSTELGAEGLMGFGAAKSAGKIPQKITHFLDAVADDARKLHQAGKKVSGNAVQSLDEALTTIANEMKGPRLAHATAYGDDMNIGINAVEETTRGAHVLEKRMFTSKYDSTHRLKPIEAARENARIKREPFDEDAWKKLSPKQKAEKLEADGYKQIEDPDKPREIVDSRTLDEGFRGDQDLFSKVNSEGFKVAHINEAGDLVPPNVEGKYKGRDVKIIEHLLQSRFKNANAESPYISLGTRGVVLKYGDGNGLAVDMKGLRKAMADGKLPGVEIIEHQDLLNYIESTKEISGVSKDMAFNFARSDNEFLIKGTIPRRFLKPIGEL